MSAAVEGEVNPGWHSADSLIVRRSEQLDADTYPGERDRRGGRPAGRAAGRPARPGAPVEVTAEEVGTPAPVVLVLTGGPVTDEIARLAAQADLVVDLTGRGVAGAAGPAARPAAAPVAGHGSLPARPSC